MKALGVQAKTGRGFPVVYFKDYYGAKSSLQASSLALCAEPGVSAVWLGVDKVEPRVMAKDAAKVGVKTEETTGWVDYPVPEEVSLNARMHLDRKQVAALIGHLQSWLETGQFTKSAGKGGAL